MKYFFCILIIWLIPILANAQVLDTHSLHVGSNTNYSFLTAQIVDGRLYLVIPKRCMDESILWTRLDDRYQYDYKQITFKRVMDEIFMEESRIWSEAGTWISLYGDRKLERNILGVFPIVEDNVNEYRIEITDILSDGSLGWENFPLGSKIQGLSWVEGVKHMKEEVMIKFTLGLANEKTKFTQAVYFSFMRLPKPMEPRRFDYRMGYWIEDVGKLRNRIKNDVGNIARWRMEKKHKDMGDSVPIKPITFILSPDIPKKWRPFVKAGIEEWLPAFRSAGFKEALVVREMDTLDEWTEHSLGHSIVRWTGNRNIRDFKESNTGSSVNRVIDLRTGEIIKSDILIGSSIESLMDAYFVRCSPLDIRAQMYPFPDELVGELIQSLVAHETGHTFGIKDNNYGEFSYSVDSVRHASWLKQMGHTPSIMTYARHNNIAQPEDNIPPYLLIQKVGPTDHYYIKWAYSEFPMGLSSQEQENQLEQIIRLQDSIAWYRYNNSQQEIIGPGATNEVVETNDPLKGAMLGLKNLERSIALLPKVNKSQKDNIRMELMYKEAIELWYNTMRNVLSLIGGYDVFYKSMDQPGSMYKPISLESQKEALGFLMEWAFNPPNWLTQPDFMSGIKYSTYPDHILTYQQFLVLELLRPKRMKRFEHMQTIEGFEGSLKSYLTNLQDGLFKELKIGSGHVNIRRQEIQMTYIDRMIMAVEEERKYYEASKKAFVQSDYTRGIMMSNLMDLKLCIEKRIKRQVESLGYWKLCLFKINNFLGE